MKIKNIFKKENKTAAKANVEKLEKNQLEKVIGGGSGDLPVSITKTDRKSGSVVASDY
jgi:ubiquinone/menaquinone biosynthesis C-methylase UbiE